MNVFAKMQEELKLKKAKRKVREAYLDKAGYMQRYEDKVCYCGRKHSGSTKTCRRCRDMREQEITIISNW